MLPASAFLLALCAPARQAAPLAEFAAHPASGAVPLHVDFDDLSQGGVEFWLWNFGDGSTSTARAPFHDYTRPGTYTVTLTVTGPAGSDSELKQDLVRVEPVRPHTLRRANVVLIVLDDVGLDRIALYGEVPPGSRAPCTPSIAALAAKGVVFHHAYANPLCSPTRAQILTGRHGFRTGVGSLVKPSGSRSGLSAAYETALPELLFDYDSSCVGKWHLADPRADGLQHPLASGFHYFAGTMFNPGAPPVDFGDGALDCSVNGRHGYYSWVKTWAAHTPGRLEQTCSKVYLTTDTADEAIARAKSMSWPWFLQVDFNAAHLPSQRPPAYLLRPPPLCTPRNFQGQNDVGLAAANEVIEALDTELGRLIDGVRAVDPEAYFILISDNGTDQEIARGSAGSCFGPDRSKGTLYEGGIRVPLIVSGPSVVPGACDALVSAVDLYATVAELAQVPSAAQDSVSLVPYLRGRMDPLRSTVYSEFFEPNCVTPDAPSTPAFAPHRHMRAIRNERYKLLRYTDDNGGEEELFFDLWNDPCEQMDLCPGRGPCAPDVLAPEQAHSFLALQAELVAMGVY